MSAQAMEALAHANEIRDGRAEIRRALRKRERTAAGVLASPPECVVTMTVHALLLEQHRWGPMRVGALLKRAGVGPRVKVGALTERQRNECLRLLEGGG